MGLGFNSLIAGACEGLGRNRTARMTGQQAFLGTRAIAIQHKYFVILITRTTKPAFMNKQSLSSSVQSSTVQINKSKPRIQAALQPYNIVYNKYQVGFT